MRSEVTEVLEKTLLRKWRDLRLKLNLQWKLLLLVAVSMLLVLFTSSYLHIVRTRRVIASDHYNSALNQTKVLIDRISAYDYFSDIEDLQQELQLVAGSRADFRQIDVYQNSPAGSHLIATTSPSAPRLVSISLGKEVAHPKPGVSTSEITRSNSDYWLITANIENPQGSGFIEALVLKSTHQNLVDQLHREYNLVLFGAIAAIVGLLYLLFNYFFRHPVKEILHAMDQTRSGKLDTRAVVKRDDELGAIAGGFNRLMDEIDRRSSEREELVKEISKLNDELFEKVEIATSELRSANAKLMRTQQQLSDSERMAAIGQVAASLAHEIGTPLNAINGHLQLLARKYADASDTQRRLAIINDQLASVVQAVKSLLERTHRRKVTMKATDLNSVVQELILLVGPMLEARNIKTLVKLDDELPPLSADRDSLYQVFLNLVNNSCDAMPEGGLLQIVTQFQPDTKLVEVLVSDSGAGISQHVVDHLFEPMFTTKQSGSGLGLIIAREIIAEHRGQIEFVSGANEGAVFRLTLPVPDGQNLTQENEIRADAA